MNAVDTVTARYAEALYGLAKRSDKLERVVADVDRVAAEFASERVRGLLLNPRFSTSERLEKLAPVLAELDELTQNFVRLCYDKNREGVLANLGAAFRAKRLAEAGAVDGIVESARPLGESELESVRKGLKARLGLDVLLTNTVDESLLGGVRVRVGSQMIDMSVQGRLTSLRDRLERAPLSAASAS